MFAVTLSKWVGDSFSHSIYDELMELKHIPYLEPHPPHYSYLTGVVDVMKPNVVTIREVETLKRVLEILQTTTHNGFPVVKKVNENRRQVYCGFILRKQLLILLDRQKYYDKDSRITPETIDFKTYITLMNYNWNLDAIIPNLPAQHVLNDYLVDCRPCKFQISTLVF